jgi:hypothetical protein
MQHIAFHKNFDHTVRRKAGYCNRFGADSISSLRTCGGFTSEMIIAGQAPQWNTVSSRKLRL